METGSEEPWSVWLITALLCFFFFWWKLTRNSTLDNKIPEEMVPGFEQGEMVLGSYKESSDAQWTMDNVQVTLLYPSPWKSHCTSHRSVPFETF